SELGKSEDQKTWFRQIEWVLSYCKGKGLDIGSGGRTLNPRTICVDNNVHVLPHIVGDGCALPFQDNSFDFIFSNQSIEHMQNTRFALLEWKRVSRSFVCIIGPDVRIHGKSGSSGSDPEHKHMFTGEEFFKLIATLPDVQIMKTYSNIAILADFFCVFKKGT
ncbi:MAG: class I SAM-dependent methyltransferase, partial [Candidatus Heimdallarchaeota archaeon]|nr:class I SAM-dependent methyltransferase [Candidatus Heimdallarchaeota archaeon]